MPQKPKAKDVKKVLGNYRPKKIGGQGGGYISAALSKAGQYTGKFIGDRLENWTGLGAYRRRYKGQGSYYESAGGQIAPIPPQFSRNLNDDFVEITHREYIGDIISSSSANTFAINSYTVNAANPNCFPWLSQIAVNYQQYKFMGAIFEFRSSSAASVNSTSVQLGTVTAAINYDSLDTAPASRQELEQIEWSMSNKTCDSFIIPVECAGRNTADHLYYCNSLGLPANADAKSYNLGTLYIASVGLQGTSQNIGSLYVTYKCRLYKTVQLPRLQVANLLIADRTSVDATNRCGTANTSQIRVNTLGATFAANTITLDRTKLVVGSRYFLSCAVLGSSTANVVTCTTTLSSGLTAISDYTNYTASEFGAPSAASTVTGIHYTRWFSVNNLDSNPVITFTGGTYPTSASATFVIMEYNSTGPSSFNSPTPGTQ